VAIEVVTKDCSALTDAELGDMADLSSLGAEWSVGLLSKQAAEWVLVTQAFEKDKLRGFVMSTLERIGGTPSLVIGVGAVARHRSRSSVLRAIMNHQFHKTLMAFPDEDVVVATRLGTPSPFDALKDLENVRPWPQVRPNGEERAWGRRLAKRYDCAEFDDRSMIARSTGDYIVFDHESLKPPSVPELFDAVDPAEGQHLIGWGWAMAEFLEKFERPDA
jgi:hypothetical protein